MAVVLLLLICCLLLLPLQESVIVLCFVVRYLMSLLVLQSSWWGKSELVTLLSLSSWYLVIVVWLFHAVPWVCLQFVIVVIHDHTHLLHVFTYFVEGCWFFLYTFHSLVSKEGHWQVKNKTSSPSYCEECLFNLFQPSVLFIRHMQTVQTLIRHRMIYHIIRFLIRIFTVCV